MCTQEQAHRRRARFLFWRRFVGWKAETFHDHKGAVISVNAIRQRTNEQVVFWWRREAAS